MKKLITLIILSSLFSLLSVTTASASWSISSYDTDIQVQENSTLIITETITADFTQEAHHGIIRIIPKKIAKEDGHLEKLRFSLVSITDENGNNLSYTRSETFDGIEYRIGKEDIWWKEPITYIITYEIGNGLSFFDDRNEVYWDAIGAAWEAPIYQASSTITLPETITINDDLNAICYAGSTGTSDQYCTWEQSSQNQIKFTTTDTLSPYEGFTIAVSFPLGHTTPPNGTIWAIYDYWPLPIIPIVFILLFSKWKRSGKDKKVHTVVPEYKPPQEMSPILAAILIDEKADMRDLSAIMIDLAIRGFIKIEEIEETKFMLFKGKDYILHRLKKSEEQSLQKFEQTLLQKIFEQRSESAIILNRFADAKHLPKDQVELSNLKNKFYKHIPELKKQMFEATMEKKLFYSRPDKTKGIYIGIGTFITIGGLASIAGFAYFTWGVLFGFSVMFSGILTIIFGYYMPKKTDEGQKLYEKILGLKMYIETAEKDRIQFHEKEKHFEELLPYAMVFGQTKHWSKQFEDIYKTPPDWYSSASWGAASTFTLSDFTHNLENATSAMTSAMATSPGGGGSGFSGGGVGGGGGGGGGGAW